MTEAPKINSRAAFAEAVQWGVATAVERGARRLWFTDPHFADWPLDDVTLLDTLTGWLRLPQRRLVLLAEGYDEVVRLKPRFVAWRRHWAHALEAWAPQDLPADLPTWLLDDGPVCVALADRVHWRGRCALDPSQAQRRRQEIDAVLQRSEPAFPVNQLGL
jgi:hypothetical protein